MQLLVIIVKFMQDEPKYRVRQAEISADILLVVLGSRVSHSSKDVKEVPLLSILTRNISSNFFP